jgi:predicted SAM-dependent methyltransferase
MKLLNVACGTRIHEDWVNIDFSKSSESVKKVNVLSGLPFADNTFDAVYSSHFLEHISRENADYVISEMYRVLKEKGILRIVVPDLENLCVEYLDILSKIDKDDNKKKYNWIVIELLDQLVRTSRGGDMFRMFSNEEVQKDPVMRKYINDRVGEDVQKYSDKELSVSEKKNNLKISKIREVLFYQYLKIIKHLIPRKIRENVFLETKIGERHLWMYDRYSLAEKLKEVGFKDIKIMDPHKSNIPNFSSYHLDTNKDGTPYKGVSSLYLEAIK